MNHWRSKKKGKHLARQDHSRSSTAFFIMLIKLTFIFIITGSFVSYLLKLPDSGAYFTAWARSESLTREFQAPARQQQAPVILPVVIAEADNSDDLVSEQAEEEIAEEDSEAEEELQEELTDDSEDVEDEFGEDLIGESEEIEKLETETPDSEAEVNENEHLLEDTEVQPEQDQADRLEEQNLAEQQ